MRSETEVNQAIERYGDTVKRICLLQLKNASDTEDIFQEVFLKYALSSVIFDSPEHEKAWIIRVTINQCKDLLKSFFRSRTVSMDKAAPLIAPPLTEQSDVLQAVLSLPPKYKNVIYLYYYEGYSAVKIAKLLGKKNNTIYTLLARGKQLLQKQLGGDEFAGSTESRI